MRGRIRNWQQKVNDLCCYEHCCYKQNLPKIGLTTNHYDWLSSLSLAEFAYNNNVPNNIGHSPFVANYRFDPRTPYNLIDPPIELIPPQNNDAVLE